MSEDRGESTGIILLAAGSSSRMGQSKQLLKVGDETLLKRSVGLAVQTGCKPVVVVLGANEKVHRQEIQDLPVSIINNVEWQRGMGNSLKAGLRHLIAETPLLQGVLIMVCDQPLLTTGYLTSAILEFTKSQSGIVASQYAGTIGVPALFSKKYFAELLRLKDDEGAKKVIQQNKESVLVLDFPDGAIDLDTPDDYHTFIA